MQPRKLASRNAATERALETSREVQSAQSRAVLMFASWESNPRCHVQGSNLPSSDTPVQAAHQKHDFWTDPKTTKAAWGDPAAFEAKP